MDQGRLQKIFSLLALLTIILIGLGSFVRATGAGLACPDWPLCFGKAIPRFTYGVTQEVVHRYLAGAVLLITGLALYFSAKNRRQQRGPFIFSASLLVLVIIQAVFGGLTVTMKLNPFIVTTHLALGTIFFQLVCLGALSPTVPRASSSQRVKEQKIKTPFRKVVFAASVLTFVQILIGGFVGASGAALSCPGFPACGTEVSDGPQVIQMTHRIFAFALSALIIAITLYARRLTEISRFVAYKPLAGATRLVLLQLVIGWLNLVYKITPALTVIHIVLAQGILHHLLVSWWRMSLLEKAAPDDAGIDAEQIDLHKVRTI